MTQSKRILLYSGRDPGAARLRQITVGWHAAGTPAEVVAPRTLPELREHLARGEHELVVIEGAEAARGLAGAADADTHLGLPLAEVEKLHILRVLAAHAGNKTRAARSLGIDTKTLYNKLKSYELSATLARRRMLPAAPGHAGGLGSLNTGAVI
jgi:DNA-binding NtrC family response regulator